MSLKNGARTELMRVATFGDGRIHPLRPLKGEPGVNELDILLLIRRVMVLKLLQLNITVTI